MDPNPLEPEVSAVVGVDRHRLVVAVIDERLGLLDRGPMDDGGVAVVGHVHSPFNAK
jgi:hypothetical protein